MADDKAPPFSYSKIIKSPTYFNAGAEADQFGANIKALNSYTDVLLTSNTDANCLKPHPLGDQFFLKTSATCKDPTTNELVARYIYISHQTEHSSGNNPLNSSDDYAKGFHLDGLIPGIINNMWHLNLFGIFGAFAEDSNPECKEVTLSSTRNLPGNICSNANTHEAYNTHFISKGDAEKVDPCSFKGGYNTYSKKYCKYNTEGFKTMASIPNDPLVYLYYTLFGSVGVYVLFCFLKKHQRKR
jgi:hypothetical protein